MAEMGEEFAGLLHGQDAFRNKLSCSESGQLQPLDGTGIDGEIAVRRR